MVKLSVVVPVYNVGRYLKKCINSLIDQDYKNIEIILVNDGSTDNSGEICDYYSNNYQNILVIHQKNSGLSAARNTGISAATGEFISFVDSDDYVTKDGYSKLMSIISENNDIDVLCANGYRVYEDKETLERILANKVEITDSMDGLNYLCYQIENKNYKPCVWLNIYKTSFIINNNLFFTKGILHEDEDWTPRVMLLAERVIYTDVMFYMYLQRMGSIMNKKDKTQNGIDIVNICNNLTEVFNQVNDHKCKKILMGYIAKLYMAGVVVGKLHRKEYKKYITNKFLIGKTSGIIDNFKSIIFITSPSLYVKLREVAQK